MPGNNQNLENKINNTAKLKLKSEGERQIANFFDTNSIKYQYEPGILVNTAEEKPRIWYPDFYLPEFGSYMEYYGLVGQKNYDKGIKTKERIYSEMGLDVIPVYPWMFTENWQGHIMTELERGMKRRYHILKSKPYWTKSESPTYRTGAAFYHR
jgi:DNA helicase-4